jgi:hypothetical protein
VARPKRKRFGAGFTKSHGREAFAAGAAAAGDGGGATLGLVAGKEAVLAFAADFRRLILAFHKFNAYGRLAKKRACEDSSQAPCVKARKTVVVS